MTSFDLSPFIGDRLVTIETIDFSWSFHFSDRRNIDTESQWRFINSEGVLAASTDHGEMFGLALPTDVIAKVLNHLKRSIVTRIEIEKPTGDLTVEFGNSGYLHFPTLSSGYESWRITFSAGKEIICQGGGGISQI